MKKQIFSAVASLAVVAAMSVSAFAVDAGSTNGSGSGTAQLAPDKAVSIIPAGVQGVQIDAAAGVFGTEGELVIEVDVEPVAEAKAAAVAETIDEAEVGVVVKSVNTVIDISAFIGDLAVQPNGEVKITVAWDGVSNQVIYVGDNGEVEVMPTEQTGNVIAFTTTHFSDFYMVTVDEDSSNGDTSGSGDDKNQPTGVVLAVIPAIAAASAIVVSKKRK